MHQQVIVEAIQFFQVTAQTKRIGLELDGSHTQYVVLARPELLRQVFMNIFDN
jgi:signal transduction histidine kinase